MAAARGADGHRNLFEVHRGTRSDFRRLLELILQSAVRIQLVLLCPGERRGESLGQNISSPCDIYQRGAQNFVVEGPLVAGFAVGGHP